uniref:RHS repeat-associated core domain-containing protein n=1 Tax=Sulfuriferula thiophila TaxID=1781211 RepID=UPI0010592BB8
GQYYDAETGLHYNMARDYDPTTGRYVQSDPIGLAGGSVSTYGYVNSNPVGYIDSTGLEIDYANHLVAAGLYHSFFIITPDNQALYINDPNFQNIDTHGMRFATIGAGPNSTLHMQSGINRFKDVHDPVSFKKKLDLPCKYANEDDAIKNLINLSNNYNTNKLWYTLLPQSMFGIPTGYNSNSFVSGLGNAAGFNMPTPENTGTNTPGYQYPVPVIKFGP